MRKVLGIVVLLMLVSACNKEFDNAMKSVDKEVILTAANKNFEQKKWKQALALYERASTYVAGTADAPNVAYNTAYANYYDKNYRLAGHQFKNFAVGNPQDPRREEASYMSSICYYKGSLDYNLDQEDTKSAINELQDFLAKFPNSEHADEVEKMLDELSFKLEYKAYMNARQYYKMADYKASVITFENVLDEFPATKLKPEIMSLMMKSKEQLAINSTFDLKDERIDQAIVFTKEVEREFPDSDQSKEAEQIRKNMEREKDSFAKLKDELDKRQAERQAKLEKLKAKYGDKDAEREVNALTNESSQLKRDSAIMATPKAGASIQLRNKNK